MSLELIWDSGLNSEVIVVLVGLVLGDRATFIGAEVNFIEAKLGIFPFGLRDE